MASYSPSQSNANESVSIRPQNRLLPLSRKSRKSHMADVINEKISRHMMTRTIIDLIEDDIC